jgi:hypothetical protein
MTMKLIKLDRRHRQYKEYQHQAAFRFEHWCKEAQEIEKALSSLTGTGGWDRSSAWYSYYGRASNRNSTRPYFVTVRDDTITSLVLLKVGKSS